MQSTNWSDLPGTEQLQARTSIFKVHQVAFQTLIFRFGLKGRYWALLDDYKTTMVELLHEDTQTLMVIVFGDSQNEYFHLRDSSIKFAL